MREQQGAANCRWAAPTLFLSSPDWVDATDRPWSCLRDEEPHELESTDACSRCVRWEPCADTAATFGEPCQHLRSQLFFLDLLAN